MLFLQKTGSWVGECLHLLMDLLLQPNLATNTAIESQTVNNEKNDRGLGILMYKEIYRYPYIHTSVQ